MAPRMTTILNTLEAPPRYIPNDPRPTLIGLTRAELAEALGRAGVPEKQRRMRAGQIWHWIYHRGVQDFAEMTNISPATCASVSRRPSSSAGPRS